MVLEKGYAKEEPMSTSLRLKSKSLMHRQKHRGSSQQNSFMRGQVLANNLKEVEWEQYILVGGQVWRAKGHGNETHHGSQHRTTVGLISSCKPAYGETAE